MFYFNEFMLHSTTAHFDSIYVTAFMYFPQTLHDPKQVISLQKIIIPFTECIT